MSASEQGKSEVSPADTDGELQLGGAPAQARTDRRVRDGPAGGNHQPATRDRGAMAEPDVWTTAALKEYVDQRFTNAERALDIAVSIANEQARATRSRWVSVWSPRSASGRS